MESMTLLVTDKSPELAERINSLLRNSGIKIQVLNVNKAVDIKRALDQACPLLIVYANADPTTASIEEVSALANEYAVPFALYSDLQNPAELIKTLKTTACLVIHSEHESQLKDTVKQLVARFELHQNQQQQRSHLEELEHRYNLLLDSSRDAMAYIHEGLHVYANRAYLEFMRVTDLSAIAGLSLLEFMQAEGVDLKKVFRSLSRGEFPQDPLKVSITRPDGTSFAAHLAFSPARFNGETCTQMLVHECDAVAGLTAELERMRITDPLTQLRTRRSFADKLEAELAEPRSVDSVSAILYVEPDGISDLQDEFDVAGMDAVIADLAHVLRSCLGTQDDAARISEYGFALLTKQANMEKVEALAGRILKAYCEHLVEIEDRSISASCSIGIATLGRLAKNSVEVIAGARKAQTEAAETGNRAVIFRPQLIAVSNFDDDRQWIDRIKLALSQHDFYSVQHSIIDLEGEGEGEHLMENLTYLRDASGDLAPQQFMGIADRNDLAGRIDHHIIPSLLKSFVESTDKQIITLSNNSILDYGFPAWLSEQMTKCCVEAGKVIIQISATAAQTNLKPAQRLMRELAPRGCKLSISEFDAERRTRALLEHLGASYIKIHRSLTENLTGNSVNQEAIRKIIEAAEAKGVCVIADEVSDTSSLAILWQCGVKLLAGSFYKEKSQVVGE
jgi:diguanylate cyclase (GGDEF)-like protein